MEPNTPRAEAERWLGIAAKMLASRDLAGSRSFAIRGRESDPTNPISEQIIAIVDTLLAAEKRVINSGHHDWYSILQLSHLARDLDLIASQYRRLVLLLNPEHNHFPFADYALRVVVDAWSVLSDPTKKWIYDSELSIFLQRNSAPPDPEPVRVDSSSSAAATYQFFQQPPPQQQPPPPQQQQWIHHLHQSEQPQVQLQERQLFHQQHHPQPQSQPPPQPQHQWLPQTQLQQLLPEQQRPSQPQWLPQAPLPQPPQPQPPTQWMPEQQRPPPQPKEPQIPPQLQRHQPQPPPPQVQQQQQQKQQQQQQKQQKKTLPPPTPPPPAPAPAQTPPFQPPPQQPPQRPPQQPPQQPPEKPPQQPPEKPLEQPQREKNGNESGTDNDNKENVCYDSANKINDDNHDGGEQIESFWTACPYCYYLFEYPETYQDCTLRCQNCRRAFQAIQIPGPPGNGAQASFCSWGFFPIGFSMTSWKKSMPFGGNANGIGSNWMPFSPMFACPVQEVKQKKVWRIVDEDQDEDEFDVSDSSDDPDSSDDWGSTRKKVKRVSGKSGRGRPRKKTYPEKEKTGHQHSVGGSSGGANANGENSQRAAETQRSVNHGAKNDVVNKAAASGSLRKQTGKGVRGRKKLDLNVEFSNEVEDHAPVTREGNNGEEVVGFFEGLDEFLSTLPILHVVGDDKAKPS